MEYRTNQRLGQTEYLVILYNQLLIFLSEFFHSVVLDLLFRSMTVKTNNLNLLFGSANIMQTAPFTTLRIVAQPVLFKDRHLQH